jgi:hypothetical protein
MRIYIAFNPTSNEWIWKESFQSPNSVMDWLKAHAMGDSSYSTWQYADLELPPEANRQIRNNIQMAVERGHRAWAEQDKINKEHAAATEISKRRAEVHAESLRQVKATVLSPEMLSVYKRELEIKELVVAQLHGQVGDIEGTRNAENSLDTDIKIRPIANEIRELEARIGYLRVNIRSAQGEQGDQGEQKVSTTGSISSPASLGLNTKLQFNKAN